MVPAGFDEANAMLDRPPNMTADECEPLQVCHTETQSGDRVVISCWKLTAEELAEINRTGRVWLMVWGETHPPLALCGVKPFAESKIGLEGKET